MPFDGSEAWRALALAIAGIVLIFATAMALSSVAHSRASSAYATSSPATQAWFKDQHNAQGQWCCDEGDGHPYYGYYAMNPDSSVTVVLDGKRHNLPAYMVLSGPNPTGAAVWWFTGAGDSHRDYCFAPGTLT